MKILKMEVLGYRDMQGRYARRTDALQAGTRDMVRTEARALLAALRFYAPKKTGQFAQGLGYRTDERPGGVTSTFYASGPHAFLLPIFVHGSKPHPIVARRARALRFFWEHGPRGPDVYYYKSVWHPGTDPDPFVSLALDSREPHFDYNLRTVSRQVIWGA